MRSPALGISIGARAIEEVFGGGGMAMGGSLGVYSCTGGLAAGCGVYSCTGGLAAGCGWYPGGAGCVYSLYPTSEGGYGFTAELVVVSYVGRSAIDVTWPFSCMSTKPSECLREDRDLLFRHSVMCVSGYGAWCSWGH